MARLNVDIPDEYYQQLKKKATESGESISDIIRNEVVKVVGLKKRATLVNTPTVMSEEKLVAASAALKRRAEELKNGQE